MANQVSIAPRTEQVDAMHAMVGWLRDRPGLPLPMGGTWCYDNVDVFHVMARTDEEFKALADQFDVTEDGASNGSYPGVARRLFGALGYEVVLLGERSSSPQLEPWDGAQRDEWLDGVLEMFDWLAERPELGFPWHAPTAYCDRDEDGSLELVFRARARSHRDRRLLADLFDRIDKPGSLPGYSNPTIRAFTGGIAYEVYYEPLVRIRHSSSRPIV